MVLGETIELDFDDGRICFVRVVPVDARSVDARATLSARLGGATAKRDVKVAQTDNGGPSVQIKIVDEAQGRYRAYVEPEES